MISRRTVEEIQEMYHLKSNVIDQEAKDAEEAFKKYDKLRNKFYLLYFILFSISVVGIGVAVYHPDHNLDAALSTSVFYLLIGFLASIVLVSHGFVALFTHKKRPPHSDYDYYYCMKQDDLLRDTKYELSESLIQGNIIRINYDKSNYRTLNMIISLDSDKKAHEYYVNFSVDEKKHTISASAYEFIVNQTK